MQVNSNLLNDYMVSQCLLYRISIGSHCSVCCGRSQLWSACINRISLVHRPGALLGDFCMLSTYIAFRGLAKTKNGNHIQVVHSWCAPQSDTVCYIKATFNARQPSCSTGLAQFQTAWSLDIKEREIVNNKSKLHFVGFMQCWCTWGKARRQSLY